MDRILKAEYKGDLTIGDMVMPCAVLEDGTRVINETNIIKNFGSNGGKNYRLREKSMQDNESRFIPLFIASKALQPFIDEIFEPKDLLPIEYETDGGQIVKGYDATILSKVCKVWITAKDAGALQASQLPKAEKAQSLIFNLADTAIIALVDEATGYQFDREKDELQKILGFYISEEKRKWEKTFPDELYKQFFRLNGWDYTVNGIKKRPGVIGTWTNMYIYDQLPFGVKEELKKRVTKSNMGNDVERMHSHLTEEGAEHLKNQIRDTIPLMRIADTFSEFKYLFQKSVDRQKGQFELPFDLDDKGHIIEREEESTLSKDNQNLTNSQNFNSNEGKKFKEKKSKQPKLF